MENIFENDCGSLTAGSIIAVEPPSGDPVITNSPKQASLKSGNHLPQVDSTPNRQLSSSPHLGMQSFSSVGGTPSHHPPCSSAPCESQLLPLVRSPLKESLPESNSVWSDDWRSVPGDTVSLSPVILTPQKALDPLLLEMKLEELLARVEQVEQCRAEVEMLQDIQAKLMSSQTLIFKRLDLVEKAVRAVSKGHRHTTFRSPPPLLSNSPSPVQLQSFSRLKEPNVPVPSSTLPASVDWPSHHTLPSFTTSACHSQELPPASSPRSPITPQTEETPKPLPYKPLSATVHTLPACDIQSAKLIPVSKVLALYPKLHCESKLGTLAVKLATLAFFGESVMVKCTVAGTRDQPALPTAQLNELKAVIFKLCPRYWKSPPEFEGVWKVCMESIGQACKRLRHKKAM